MNDTTTIKLTVPQFIWMIITVASFVGTLMVGAYRLTAVEEIVSKLPPVEVLKDIEALKQKAHTHDSR